MGRQFIRASALCLAALLPLQARNSRAQATPGGATIQPPGQARLCIHYCFVLTLNRDHYDSVQEGTGDKSPDATYKIISFSSASVILERYEGGRLAATLKGKLAKTGNEVDSATAILTWHLPDGTDKDRPFQMSWSDLNADAKATLPPETTTEIDHTKSEVRAVSVSWEQIGVGFYIVVTNRSTLGLVAFSVSYRHEEDPTKLEHAWYYPHKANHPPIAPGAGIDIPRPREFIDERLSAAIFTDGSTLGTSQELSDLRAKGPDATRGLAQPPRGASDMSVGPDTSPASPTVAAGLGSTEKITVKTALTYPVGIAIGDSGAIYIADYDVNGRAQGNRVIKVNPSTGDTKVIVNGDNKGNPATGNVAFRSTPAVGVTTDNKGNLYAISGVRICKIKESTGSVTQIDSRPTVDTAVSQTATGATEVHADAGTHYVEEFGFDSLGNIYTNGDDGVLKVWADSKRVTTFVDKSRLKKRGNRIGIPIVIQAESAGRRFGVDGVGNVYIVQPTASSDYDTSIIKIDAKTQMMTTVARVLQPISWFTVDQAGDIFFGGESKLFRIAASGGKPTSFADMPAGGLTPMTADRSGNLYVLMDSYIQKYSFAN